MKNYIFIAEKRDITTKACEALLINGKSIKTNTPVVKGKLKTGEDVTILTCAGHLLEVVYNGDKKYQKNDNGRTFWQDIKDGVIKLPVALPDANDTTKYLLPSTKMGGALSGADRLKQFEPVIKAANKDTIFVSFCDEDDEGFAIFAEIMLHFGQNPYGANCLNIDTVSLALDKIESNFKKMQPVSNYENTVNRAFCRRVFDWNVGMNATAGMYKSTGRVQGGVTAIVAENYLQRRDFAEVITGYEVKIIIDGTTYETAHRFSTKTDAEEFVAKLNNDFTMKKTTAKKEAKPPKMHNEITLTKAFTGTGVDVAAAASDLRLKHGILSYLRTKDTVVAKETASDLSRFLTDAIKNKTHKIDYSLLTEKFNKASIGVPKTHDAVHVTGLKTASMQLSRDENMVYDEVYLNVMAQFAPNVKYNQDTITLVPGTTQDKEVAKILKATPYKQTFNTLVDKGWSAVYPKCSIKFVETPDTTAFKKFDTNIIANKTKPRASFTKQMLLAKMDNIANDIEDKEMKALFKQCEGIGTTATANSIIDLLADVNLPKGRTPKGVLKIYKKGQVIDISGEKCKKDDEIEITPEGLRFYEAMAATEASIVNILETALLERDLQRVASGELTPKAFIEIVEANTADLYHKLKKVEFKTANSGNGAKGGFPVHEAIQYLGKPIPLDYFGTKISKTEAVNIAKTGKTAKTYKFKSKAGNDYEAHLGYREDGKFGQVFVENKDRFNHEGLTFEGNKIPLEYFGTKITKKEAQHIAKNGKTEKSYPRKSKAGKEYFAYLGFENGKFGLAGFDNDVKK